MVLEPTNYEAPCDMAVCGEPSCRGVVLEGVCAQACYKETVTDVQVSSANSTCGPVVEVQTLSGCPACVCAVNYALGLE